MFPAVLISLGDGLEFKKVQNKMLYK